MKRLGGHEPVEDAENEADAPEDREGHVIAFTLSWCIASTPQGPASLLRWRRAHHLGNALHHLGHLPRRLRTARATIQILAYLPGSLSKVALQPGEQK